MGVRPGCAIPLLLTRQRPQDRRYRPLGNRHTCLSVHVTIAATARHRSSYKLNVMALDRDRPSHGHDRGPLTGHLLIEGRLAQGEIRVGTMAIGGRHVRGGRFVNRPLIGTWGFHVTTTIILNCFVIQHPIIQGCILCLLWGEGGRLGIAVSKAGGLGIITG